MSEPQKWEITTGSWVRAVVVIAIAYALFLVRDFVLVIITSIIIASAMEPVARWSRRNGMSRLPMILLVYIVTGVLFTGLFYFVLLPLLGEMSDFIKTLTIYTNTVNNGGVVSDLFRSQSLFGNFNTPIVITQLSARLNDLSDFLSQGVFSSLSVVFGGILNFLITIILSFYLAIQEDGISKFLKMITPLKYEPYVISLWRRSQVKIGYWMQGQLIISATVALLVYIGLLIANVPNALLLAMTAGVFDLVPIVGPLVASVPAIFIGFTSGGSSLALITAGIYIVVQQFENHVILPVVHKRMAGVPPTVSIMALVIGGTLAGFFGILISIPVAAVVIEFISDFEERKISRKSIES